MPPRATRTDNPLPYSTLVRSSGRLALFLRSDSDLLGGGGATALAYAMPARGGVAALADRLRDIDWTPDLGARIGSLEWFRGAATCLALCTVSWMPGPSLHAPIIGAAPPDRKSTRLNSRH